MQTTFLNPPTEFTPMPFWFWNDALTEDEITRQIDDFLAHGVSGFVIHPRKGLPGSIPYLGSEYMRFVRHAVMEAAKRGMLVTLYDEAMYPSGAAHGMVAAENPAWASRCLWLETADASVPAADDVVAVCAAMLNGSCADRIRAVTPVKGVYPHPGQGMTLLIFREGFSGGTIRGIHENEDDGEPNAPKSADLLNPDAVQAFIRITHERYYAELADFFGTTVIAMFTDEPDITGRNSRPGAIAWTRGFLAEFGSAEDLPALFLQTDGSDQIRRRYRQTVNARMIRTCYQPLADWCAAHGIALTGHPAKGYDMALLTPFQLPAQDVVWRFVEPGDGVHGDESVLAKCASDAARHNGARRNGNECFGCCGAKISQWAMTAADMKWYMDYLFVRGCNLLFPHAFYYSVRDGRGGERPPDAGPNNAWWPEYRTIADYMRRLCWLNTDSINQARVAVLCEGDRMNWQEVIPLYEQQIEFNYLLIDLLSDCTVEDGALKLRNQRYTHLLIPADTPLTDDQRQVVDAFLKGGGRLLDGELPRDAVITPAAADLRVTHVVKEGMHLYLLTNEGNGCIIGKLRVPVTGHARWWNAWRGDIRDAAAVSGEYPIKLNVRESIILAIDPANQSNPETALPADAPVIRLRVQEWRVIREDGTFALLTADASGALPGWQTVPGWETYSGWVRYDADADIPPGIIDLGEVHELARMYVDGELVGTRLWEPYAFTVTKPGRHITLEIANTPAGKMDGVSLPSGLLGG